MKHTLLLVAVCLVRILAQAQTDYSFLIKQQLKQQGLAAGDVEQIAITNQYTSKHNGIEHIYFRQK